ncbi:hypothetical protein M601_005480 [Cellulophaga baltica 4]|nr:hypothetical protein M601_005480 [Cellulophaga baltica 4]
MKNLIKHITFILLLVSVSACNTEYLDPNSTLEPDVVNNTDNLIELLNGVQKRWSSDRSGAVYTYTSISGA